MAQNNVKNMKFYKFFIFFVLLCEKLCIFGGKIKNYVSIWHIVGAIIHFFTKNCFLYLSK